MSLDYESARNMCLMPGSRVSVVTAVPGSCPWDSTMTWRRTVYQSGTIIALNDCQAVKSGCESISDNMTSQGYLENSLYLWCS